VIGASAGIGRGIATRLVTEGADVVFCGRREDALQRAVKSAGGGRYVVADVADPKRCDGLVEDAVEILGGLDLLVFAASSSRLGRLRETSADEWHTMLYTNVLGPNLVIRAALGHLAEDSLVAVLSSESVGNPLVGLAPYATTKAALEELVRGWRVEHPELRFATVTVGSTGGTEFARDFDLELAAELLPQWVARGQVPAQGMEAADLGCEIAQLLATALEHPGVDCQQIILRPAGGIFTGSLDVAMENVRAEAS
jgi:NAD(P)-dependent dehydrogenase (short-subunit alcohol dehydrogenase family)